MPATTATAAAASGTAAAGAATTAAAAAAAGTTAAAGTAASSTLLGLSIAGIALSAVSSAQIASAQSKNQSAIAEANADQSDEEARLRKVAGLEKQRILLDERRRILARNRARFGKGGVVFEGSPLIVQQEAARNLTNNAETEAFNTELGIRGAEREAQISIARGKSARVTGKLQAGQALFTGGAQIAKTKLDLELAKNA